MPVNETLGQYGDWAYTTAVAIYVLAMLFFLFEQSFGRKGRQAAARTRVLAGAGGPDEVETTDVPQEPERGRAERIGRMGAALTVLAALLHLASLVLRGVATQRVPWSNMHEYISAICLVGVVTWLVVLRKSPVRHLSAFVLFPVVMLMWIGGSLLYAEPSPLTPPLQSYWIIIHVSAAVIGSGVFLVPGVASVLYLMRSRHERNPDKLAKFGPRLPSLEVLDRIAYRTTVFAFPVFTFGVIAGGIWAEAAWGRFWGWDPKETVAFIAWVIYAAYLHSRATAGWRGNRAAIINVLGFSATVFNLFFVNLVTVGLHSYAGVS
ncbi:c-type cytochrome biogenesis protein CcsB [Amycolatopsis suaedae]|uniref:C-type cytochrome biogenesis protein CcsB n=1 Tax=Amycolatopsis suaedae TaxID=2510978 RepID=A0A4Q7JAK2_9PSEU|nr:c-type cytochrome biogenesis protein CcsB [Amycolatopsis suaedae]RZQ64287.1 c-type cytochrome biogenesis protein CcsB [Amycolatopsis suaedae]